MTRQATYTETLRVFRDLCDGILSEGFSNEYVRGGVNLIADLFGVVGQPVDERMDDVLADLQALPLHASQIHLYGVSRDLHEPSEPEDQATEERIRALELRTDDNADAVSDLAMEISDLSRDLESLRIDFDTHDHD